MKPARISLAGILLLIAGSIGMFALTPDHLSLVDVQIPRSRAEFGGLIRFGDVAACAEVRKGLEANLAGDNIFPLCYSVCFLAMLWFAMMHRPVRSWVGRGAAVLAAFAILATVILDYRENSATLGVLQNACSTLPANEAIQGMKSASLDKWGVLGIAMWFFGMASASVPLRRPDRSWFTTFGSIRTIAALVGGACGIGTWILGEPELASLEFNSFSVVALASLWQALLVIGAKSWRRNYGNEAE